MYSDTKTTCDVVVSATMQKFYPNRFSGFAPLGTKWLRYFGGFWERDARTDFDAKYVKRRGSALRSAFWGSQNQYLRRRPRFTPKPSFFGPISTDDFFRPKTALILDGSRLNDPKSSLENTKSCVVYEQIGVGDSKNVIYNPLVNTLLVPLVSTRPLL